MLKRKISFKTNRGDKESKFLKSHQESIDLENPTFLSFALIMSHVHAMKITSVYLPGENNKETVGKTLNFSIDLLYFAWKKVSFLICILMFNLISSESSARSTFCSCNETGKKI